MTTLDDAERWRTLAKQTNRLVWQLIGTQERSAADDETMVHAAHASAFHWASAGGPVEWARAEWLVSHVYVLLGRVEGALYHARRSLALCEEHGIGDFDLAYAYEGMARAEAAAGDAVAVATWRAKAAAAGAAIADAEDRDLFEADLAASPWFGTDDRD